MMKIKQRRLVEPLIEFLVESATDRILNQVQISSESEIQILLQGALEYLTKGVIRDAYTERKWLAVLKEMQEIMEAKPPSIEEQTKAAALCLTLGILETSMAKGEREQQTTTNN